MKKQKIELLDNSEPEAGQIRATDLLRWVAEHRDAYPIPEGTSVGDHVVYDIPETIFFDVTHWVSLSKASFAKFALFKSQAQISRWIRAGMPVRPDGRLNYWQCLEWLDHYDEVNKERRATGWRY